MNKEAEFEGYPARLEYLLNHASETPGLLNLVILEIRKRMKTAYMSSEDKLKCEAILVKYEMGDINE